MGERRLEGLVLKVGPLGEHDRLLTLLSDAEGVTRLAVPGARRPKSSLAAAAPLTLLELQVGDAAAWQGFDNFVCNAALPIWDVAWRRLLPPRPSAISACD